MRRASLALVFLAGCAARPPVGTPVALLGDELRKQDEDLVGQRFRTVLDFEHPADRAFVQTSSATPAAGHTGQGGLRCGPSASVNISSLLFGLRLPGDFTLIGAYVRPTADRVTTTLVVDGKPIARTQRRVSPGSWAFAAIDLTGDAVKSALATAKKVQLDLQSEGNFDLDDVMFTDNRRTMADVTGEWVVRRDGLSLVVQYAGRPPLRIPSIAAGDDGWLIEEADRLRVRLRNAAGTSFWTLLADGRASQGPSAKAVDAGVLQPDTATCRLDLESAGDVDNDGYNERRMAFQLVAKTERPRFSLKPTDNQFGMLVEIRNLPADAKWVTADGKLIDTVCRPDDTTLLVRLPARADGAIEVSVGPKLD